MKYKHLNRRICIGLVGLTIATLSASLFLLRWQLNQATLDGKLVVAVKQLDAPRVDRLLLAGANPNADDDPARATSVNQVVRTIWQRLCGHGKRPFERHSVLELCVFSTWMNPWIVDARPYGTIG